MAVPRAIDSARITDSQPGILLIGHGSRDEVGNEEFKCLAGALRNALSPKLVATCYLELRQPDISAGFRELHAQGVNEIVIAPVLLFDARHARQDIPAEVAKFREEAADVKLRYAESLGRHPAVMVLAQKRLEEVLVEQASQPFTSCIVVFRGTSDPVAQQAIQAFVDARRPAMVQAAQGDVAVSLAYVAAAEPRLKDVLDQSLAAGAEKILLLPHLLFHGEVLAEIRQLAAETAEKFPQTEILVADHLGVGLRTMARGSELLVEAFLDRIRDAQSF